MFQAYVTDKAVSPNFIPRKDGKNVEVVRGTVKGYLSYLESSFEQGARPDAQHATYYGRPQQDRVELVTCFEPVIQIGVLSQTVRTHQLALENTSTLMTILRDAVMSNCGLKPCPAYISGHNPDGSVARENHIAFFPIANVDNKNADGSIKGVGIALPRGLTPEQRRTLLQALGRTRELWGNEQIGEPLGRWNLSFDMPPDDPKWAQPRTWVKPSRFWGTVTPYVYDRYRLSEEGRCISIAESCRYIGLPPPAQVRFTPYSEFVGVPNASYFPKYVAGSEPRHSTHVTLEFSEPVSGPVLLGSGRYKGYGLCRPLESF
jgi:CRISPR-associated protein Csb2